MATKRDPESAALIKIVNTLKPLDKDNRARVLMSVHLLLNIPLDKPIESEKFRLVSRAA